MVTQDNDLDRFGLQCMKYPISCLDEKPLKLVMRGCRDWSDDQGVPLPLLIYPGNRDYMANPLVD